MWGSYAYVFRSHPDYDQLYYFFEYRKLCVCTVRRGRRHIYKQCGYRHADWLRFFWKYSTERVSGLRWRIAERLQLLFAWPVQHGFGHTSVLRLRVVASGRLEVKPVLSLRRPYSTCLLRLPCLLGISISLLEHLFSLPRQLLVDLRGLFGVRWLPSRPILGFSCMPVVPGRGIQRSYWNFELLDLPFGILPDGCRSDKLCQLHRRNLLYHYRC